MSNIEIVAVIFSLLSVALTVKNNIWCWPTGMIGIIFYSILFYQNQIWGNMILQGLFIGQSILGWYNWNSPSKYPIQWIKPKNQTTVFCIMVLMSVLIYSVTSKSGGNLPYFDALSTSLSITGMVLLAYRKMENWIYWITADLIFIWMFYTSHLYLSSGIYFIFLLLSILGHLEWRKSIKVD